MAHRIVSWSDNDICISPVLSTAASVVSFDSTFSDTYPSHSQMPPNPKDPGLPSAEFGAQLTSLPGSHTVLSEGRKQLRDGHAIPGVSFVRHNAYFFEDGNVTFLVDGTLYCVHRYFFSRDSVYFSTRFAKLGIRDHEALPTIISIGDVERKDFEALLSVLYPTNFEAHELSYEHWKSVLHLSTRWGFASLRNLALKSINPPTSHDQLVLARTYSVDQWVLPALTSLCSRTLPLSLDEARQMSMEDVILVATVREEIRDGALRVDAADIPCHIEVVQAGKPIRPVSNSELFGMDPVNKSVSESTGDLLGGGLNPDFTSGHAPARSGESQLPPLMGEVLPADTRDGSPQEDVCTRKHPTVKTEVPVAADVATAGPTTAADLPEGGGAEGVDEADKWAGIPVKTKKKKGGKNVVPGTPSGWDDWGGVPVKTKKKNVVPVTPSGWDEWGGVPVKTKKKVYATDP